MKNVNDIQALQTISVEQLRSFDGFDDISIAEAQQIIQTLKELSLLTHNIVTNHEESKSISTLRQAE